MYTINFWPVLISSVVGFGISALWYSPFLFGKQWMSLIKANQDEMKSGIWKSYLIQFILSLITFSVLGFAISGFGINHWNEGAFVGFLAWLGFTLPISIGEFLWKKQCLKLIAIDAVNTLIIFFIGGAIIAAWM